MRVYICLFKDRKLIVEASTTYEAQRKAAALFKARKPWDVSVFLADQPISPATI